MVPKAKRLFSFYATLHNRRWGNRFGSTSISAGATIWTHRAQLYCYLRSLNIRISPFNPVLEGQTIPLEQDVRGHYKLLQQEEEDRDIMPHVWKYFVPADPSQGADMTKRPCPFPATNAQVGEMFGSTFSYPTATLAALRQHPSQHALTAAVIFTGERNE